MKSKSDFTVHVPRAREADMVSCVADDLRNPLTTMKTCVELLDKKVGDTIREEDVKLLDMIREQSNRITKVVSELLHCSKDCGMEPVELSLLRIVRAVIRKMTRQSMLQEVNVDLEIPVDCYVRGNVYQLERVFENLIKNSLEAMQGSGNIKILLDSESSDEMARVRVLDSGPGVDEQLRNRVFDSFFSTRENNAGMGLAICKNIIESHEGTLTLEGSGNGCSFLLSLPVADRPVMLGGVS